MDTRLGIVMILVTGTEAAERPAAPGCPAAVSQDRRRGAGGGGELGGGSRRRGR